MGDNQHSYLVLLRELEIVVCLEALNVICQLRDRDGRVACHACRAKTSRRVRKKGDNFRRVTAELLFAGKMLRAHIFGRRRRRKGREDRVSFSGLSLVGGRKQCVPFSPV